MSIGGVIVFFSLLRLSQDGGDNVHKNRALRTLRQGKATHKLLPSVYITLQTGTGSDRRLLTYGLIQSYSFVRRLGE